MDGISDILRLIKIILEHPWLILVLLLIIVVLLIIYNIKKINTNKEENSKQFYIVSGKLFDFIQNIFQRQLGDVLLFENREDAKNSFLLDISSVQNK